MHETHGRLVAIMFVQVSEPADKNRELPVDSARIRENLQDILIHLKKFRGNLLEIRHGEIYAYFPGGVLSFNAALSLQSILPQFNLRIGLHLGEVLFRKEKLQGRDVNLASRLPSCARAGGICMSQSVYQYLEDPDKQRLVALGRHNLKNIDVEVPLYAYLPAGQLCRRKTRELRRLLLEKLRRNKRAFSISFMLAAIAIIPYASLMDNSVPGRKVINLYLPQFKQQAMDSKHRSLLQSTEFTVRSRLAGKHNFFNLHLLQKRSFASIELLVTIKQVTGRIQAEYILNSLPDGKNLASGRVEEDEKKVFYLQHQLAEQILATLNKLK
jgi:adenylate cyclase